MNLNTRAINVELKSKFEILKKFQFLNIFSKVKLASIENTLIFIHASNHQI
jgi:hypothetical protein